jgi:hypothetical protein
VNRQQAISLIEEIDAECKEIVGRSFMLVKPEEHDELAAGYQVRVKALFDERKIQCIQTLLAQYGYKLRSEPEIGSVLIFEPRSKKGFTSLQDAGGYR